MWRLLIASAVFSLSAQAAHLDQLIPLETDFCTNFSEGTRENREQWKHCCLIHDMYFWAGGAKDDRLNADLELKACIAETGAQRIAELIFHSVRLGSYSPIKYSKKKWNHGWKKRKEFQRLTSQDVDLIEAEISRGYDFISPVQKIYFIQQLRSRPE